MKLKEKVIKVSVVFLLASVAISLNLKGSGPIHIFGINTSEPLAYLFQIIFILFFISPPIIAVLLFLIWKELRERNKMK